MPVLEDAGTNAVVVGRSKRAILLEIEKGCFCEIGNFVDRLVTHSEDEAIPVFCWEATYF